MDFSLKIFYEQIKEYGTPIKPASTSSCMEVYQMQDGTRAYIYKGIDKDTIIQIELMKR